jgi:hypothetical protein
LSLQKEKKKPIITPMSSLKAAIRREVHGFCFNNEILTIDQTLVTGNNNLELGYFQEDIYV